MALVSLIGAGFSAQAGLTHLDTPTPAPRAAVVAANYESQDHFPGAALLYAEDSARISEVAAPVAGVTGTIALPDLPVPQNAVIDATIRPAQPFVLRGTSGDQARALQCLTTAIYYEAASEPDDGQAAVAQVILNRVRHPAFPPSVCGVVYQGSERAGCQFSFACDGAMARVPMRAAWERARRTAALALAGRVFAPVGLATHYHTYAVRPSWQKSLVMTGVFGAHFFHRWKGWWGTAAAFNQPYSGHEPDAAPHPRGDVIVPVPEAIPAPVIAALSPAIKVPTPVAEIVAAHSQSGTPQPEYAALPNDSQVLDKWKDSGKPLR
ncbi:cell wall hydrolase [Sphingomonas sp.]|uniref:cell wall hydrolase n=1 Tax=Sphingomonas sp. TaxID=28214 RepID=UPI002C717D73|nr:cell wall hydrolase [Sphingomonas sp.]HWK36068.1 cell wall hydrolase [Sphingomonas sp.]